MPKDTFSQGSAQVDWIDLVDSSDSSRKQIFRDILGIFCHENVCCAYLLESPRWGDSNNYTQCSITFRKIEVSLNSLHLLYHLALCLTLTGSNSPCLEQSFMVSKMFQTLMFDCRFLLGRQRPNFDSGSSSKRVICLLNDFHKTRLTCTHYIFIEK